MTRKQRVWNNNKVARNIRKCFKNKSSKYHVFCSTYFKQYHYVGKLVICYLTWPQTLTPKIQLGTENFQSLMFNYFCSYVLFVMPKWFLFIKYLNLNKFPTTKIRLLWFNNTFESLISQKLVIAPKD